MINLLLMILMIAALTGMVLCNRRHRRGFRYQVIALSLLVVVIASGGLFMCRIDTGAMIGLQDHERLHMELENKLKESQAYSVMNFIRSNAGKNPKVLLITPSSESLLNLHLENMMFQHSAGSFFNENIQLKNTSADNLVSPMEDQAAETALINQALDKHQDADWVILAGFAPSGESLYRLKLFSLPESRRPQLIIIGLTNLNRWVEKQLQEGCIDALVVTDLTKSLQGISATELPENLYEVFNSRYVLINRDNLRRNRRFFHD